MGRRYFLGDGDRQGLDSLLTMDLHVVERAGHGDEGQRHCLVCPVHITKHSLSYRQHFRLKAAFPLKVVLMGEMRKCFAMTGKKQDAASIRM